MLFLKLRIFFRLSLKRSSHQNEQEIYRVSLLVVEGHILELFKFGPFPFLFFQWSAEANIANINCAFFTAIMIQNMCLNCCTDIKFLVLAIKMECCWENLLYFYIIILLNTKTVNKQKVHGCY